MSMHVDIHFQPWFISFKKVFFIKAFGKLKTA